MVTTTSKKAYFEIKAEGITQEQQLYILGFLCSKFKPVTNKEISVALGIDTGSIAGRINAMIKSGHVNRCEQRACKVTGRTAYTSEVA